MSKQSLRISAIMMTVSTILLLALQLWWLRTEYQTAVGNFERETDLVFKSTVKQIADSAMYRQFRKFMVLDDSDSVPTWPPKMNIDAIKGLQQRAEIKIESITIDSKPEDSARKMMLRKRFDMAKVDTDSLVILKSSDAPKDFRFVFDFGLDKFDVDSLKNLYKSNLTVNIAKLNITILDTAGSFPILHIVNDSLAFTTNYYRLGSDKLYAATFTDAKPFIIKSMLAQLGFSIFLSLLVVFSFGLVYRHLKAQQKLIIQKNEFIANVTHELKTPVATVGVALEAIKDFDVLKNPEKAREYLHMATQELDRLSRMTDRILNTSIFDLQEDIRLHKEPVLLKECIEDALKSLQVIIEKAALTVELKLQTDGAMHGNKEHLTQMVHNVIENAIKYGGENGRLEIELTQKEKELQLRISDQGAGIPEGQLKKVFEKFYRVPTHDVHNVKGHGLGLSYVKGVVEYHQGAIRLENRKEGGLSVQLHFKN